MNIDNITDLSQIDGLARQSLELLHTVFNPSFMRAVKIGFQQEQVRQAQEDVVELIRERDEAEIVGRVLGTRDAIRDVFGRGDTMILFNDPKVPPEDRIVVTSNINKFFRTNATKAQQKEVIKLLGLPKESDGNTIADNIRKGSKLDLKKTKPTRLGDDRVIIVPRKATETYQFTDDISQINSKNKLLVPIAPKINVFSFDSVGSTIVEEKGINKEPKITQVLTPSDLYLTPKEKNKLKPTIDEILLTKKKKLDFESIVPTLSQKKSSGSSDSFQSAKSTISSSESVKIDDIIDNTLNIPKTQSKKKPKPEIRTQEIKDISMSPVKSISPAVQAKYNSIFKPKTHHTTITSFLNGFDASHRRQFIRLAKQETDPVKISMLNKIKNYSALNSKIKKGLQ